jgi:hypothetical protein
MADNSTQTGNDTIASDEVATLNGSGSTGVKVQRVKVAFGDDGDSRDASAAFPLPVGDAIQQQTVKQKNSTANVTDYGQVMLAQRRDSDTAETTADGQYTGLKMDQAGRLKVAIQAGDIVATSGSITAAAQTVFVNTNRLGALSITMAATTLVGHNAIFEVSNDSTNGTDGNWKTAQVVRTDSNVIETTTGVLAATPSYGWELNVANYTYFRVRATAHTSGTAAYVLKPSAIATEPVPSSQNPDLILFPYSLAGIIAINTDLIVIDCAKFKSLSIQCLSMGTTGVVTAQWANDAAFTLPVTATLLSESGASSTTFNAAVLRNTNVLARYFRLRLTTATTAGTTTINVQASQATLAPIVATQPVSIAALPALVAGANAIGDVGIQYRANATGAATTFKFASAATVNNALILTGARRLLGWSLTNTTAAFKYFRFYNLATAPASGASPTFMIGLPPNSTTTHQMPGGLAMSLGLGIACTGAAADLDATVTAANDVVGAIFYV